MTEHGDGIAQQIYDDDAYGYSNDLNIDDVYGIIDQMHTHFLDQCPKNDKIIEKLGKFLDEISDEFDIEVM